MLSISAADATAFVSVHCRASGQSLPDKDGVKQLFAHLVVALLNAPAEERQGAVSMFAAAASDAEWTRCTAVLSRVHPEVAALSRSVGEHRKDWRWVTVARAISGVLQGPTSGWWSVVTTHARMKREALGVPAKEGRYVELLVRELVANPRAPHAALLTAYATEAEWPALRACFEQCRLDLAWVDAFRDPENAAAVKRLADATVEEELTKAGRRMS